jgi:hypothetical protein
MYVVILCNLSIDLSVYTYIHIYIYNFGVFAKGSSKNYIFFMYALLSIIL